MEISKSTPYVRYKKDFTSSLHLGTIHIESEYLDRTQKTTIESIHGMTWHNKVVNENKELNLLSDTQLELTELEKQYWNTGEKRVSVDEIHTLEEVEPNEDGTYTYMVNSMEGEYIEIYDGINNITSTSDGLDGQFEIVYDTTEEDINGNIALDSIAPQYEIADSGIGAITGAKSTGLTLVNHITESSKEEVVAIEQQEGQCFTIKNTVQGNIKSAILKGQTLNNLISPLAEPQGDFREQITLNGLDTSTNSPQYRIRYGVSTYKLNKGKTYLMYFELLSESGNHRLNMYGITENYTEEYFTIPKTTLGVNMFTFTPTNDLVKAGLYVGKDIDYQATISKMMVFEYQNGMENWDISYFEGMKSVQMPVLTTTGKNLISYTNNNKTVAPYQKPSDIIYENGGFKFNVSDSTWKSVWYDLNLKPNTLYTLTYTTNSIGCFVFKSKVNTYIETELLASKGQYSNNEDSFVSPKLTFTTDSKGFVRIRFTNSMTNGHNIIKDIQLEEGSTATSYKPYKSNILTTSEEVELRGIGDVKDELNLITGELTQRIGEMTINGSERNWGTSGHSTNRDTTSIFTITNKEFNGISNSVVSILSNSLPSLGANFQWGNDVEGIALNTQNTIVVSIDRNKLESDDLIGFTTWLSQNPITFQYPFTTESVKTVDLTVQNQDGGIIPHIQTQQGITHVSTSSDGLTPVVAMSCQYDTIIKPNTTYTIKLDRPNVSDTMYLQVDLGGTMMMLDADVNAFTIKTPSTLSHSQLRLSGTGNTVKEIIVLEGNRVNDKIEYFEGMKNVENPILIVSNCPYVFGKGGRI